MNRIHKPSALFLILGALFSLALPAQATTIFYSVSLVSGNTYEYSYLAQNDSLSFPVDEITIFFDAAQFENLQPATVPSGWDPLVVQPDLLLADDGFFDAIALGPSDAIQPGLGLGGFSIRFDWLGSGAPGTQPFEIRDAITFDLVDTGFTVPIPEPTSALLIGFGLCLLSSSRARATRPLRMTHHALHGASR